jgi:hypothetical protein
VSCSSSTGPALDSILLYRFSGRVWRLICAELARSSCVPNDRSVVLGMAGLLGNTPHESTSNKVRLPRALSKDFEFRNIKRGSSMIDARCTWTKQRRLLVTLGDQRIDFLPPGHTSSHGFIESPDRYKPSICLGEPATGFSRMKTCLIGDAIHPGSCFSGVPTIIFLDQGGSSWAEELFQCQVRRVERCKSSNSTRQGSEPFHKFDQQLVDLPRPLLLHPMAASAENV